MSKRYSFDEYMKTFSPQTCRKCEGEGKLFEFGRLVCCDACDGTGRKDKKPRQEIINEIMKRMRVTRAATTLA
jgi:DnaJ-class molecular chaperone